MDYHIIQRNYGEIHLCDFEAVVLYNAMTIYNSEVTAIYHYTSFVQTYSFEKETWVDAVDVTDKFSLDLNKQNLSFKFVI